MVYFSAAANKVKNTPSGILLEKHMLINGSLNTVVY